MMLFPERGNEWINVIYRRLGIFQNQRFQENKFRKNFGEYKNLTSHNLKARTAVYKVGTM